MNQVALPDELIEVEYWAELIQLTIQYTFPLHTLQDCI
jgi:hypothetical protein